MSRYKTEAMAAGAAKAKGLCYGLCVFDGRWYVGTALQVESVGCTNVREG